jgi:hypothetical protein
LAKSKSDKTDKQCDPVAVEDSAQAIELRKLGLSYREIGERLGLGIESVKAMVAEEIALLEGLSEGEALLARRLQLERINKMRVALMSKALKGDATAVNSILKCDEYESKLLNGPAAKNQNTEIIYGWYDDEESEKEKASNSQ